MKESEEVQSYTKAFVGSDQLLSPAVATGELWGIFFLIIFKISSELNHELAGRCSPLE